MFNSIIRRLKGYTRVAALHIDVQKDGQWEVHACVLLLKKNNIELESFFTNISKEGISELPLKDLPVSILVTGKGNINKKTGPEISRLNDLNSALQVVLPNAKLSEFMIDYVQAGEGYVISAIRQDQLQEQILPVLKENDIQYVAVQAGFVSLVRWYEQIADKTDHIDIASYRLIFQDKKLKSLQLASTPEQNEIEVLNKYIPGRVLPSLLCAIELLAGQGITLAIQKNATVAFLEEEYKYKQLFRNTGIVAIGIFFIVLLVNFMFYSSYKSEYEQLQQKEATVLSVVNKLKTMQKEVKEKETFLKAAGWEHSSRISWYCDQLASGMTNGLSLLELSVYPYDALESRKEKKSIFKPRQIFIRGLCANPVKVNEWAKRLDEQVWISNVNIDKYTKDSKTGLSEFYLTISLNED